MTKPKRSIDFSAIDTYRDNIAQSEPLKSLSPLEPVNDLPINQLDPAPWNARRYFDSEQIKLLGQDMLENGQIHAIMVRPTENGRFEVVVGERRLRAAQVAGMPTLKANIRQLTNREARRIGLSENLQRQDLNDYEETIGWLDLLSVELEPLPEFKLLCQQNNDIRVVVAKILNRYQNEFRGKTKIYNNVIVNPNHFIMGSPIESKILEVFQNSHHITWESFVTNRLPILSLPQDLLDVMQRGELEYTKAKELSKIKDPKTRADLLERVLQLSLPLTQIKTLVSQAQKALTPAPPPSFPKLRPRVQTIAKQIDTLPAKKRQQAEALLNQLERLFST